MRHAVGIDIGGTRATAVLVDGSGREIARAEVAGSVASDTTLDRTVTAVEAALDAVLSLGRVGRPLGALWVGAAGAGREEVRAALRRGIEGRRSADRVEVGTDIDAALESAFAGGPGILLIAGTGSAAVAVDGSGGRWTVGGWGARLGDEGSAFWIALRALRALCRGEDGRGPETALRGEILGRLGLSRVSELITWTERASKGEIAALAPAVFAAREADDWVAARILAQAVAELERHVVTLRSRIAAGGAIAPRRLALSGGLIAPDGPLRSALLAALRPLGLDLLADPIDPAGGAARRALALLD